MCGLVGVFGQAVPATGHRPEVAQAFSDGLEIASLRGTHSTGAGFVTKYGRVERIRKAEPAYSFVSSEGLEIRNNTQVSTFAMLGHARYATLGGRTAINAHPFQFGSDFIGTHNGTIDNAWEVFDTRLSHLVAGDTDSEMVLAMLYTNKAEDILPLLGGTYVLVWWDGEKLNIARNGSVRHQLWLAFDDKNGRVFYASEKQMLPLMLGRNGIEFNRIVPVEKNTLWTYKPDIKRGWVFAADPWEYKHTPTKTVNVSSYSRGGGWTTWWEREDLTIEADALSKTIEEDEAPDQQQAPWESNVDDDNHYIVTHAGRAVRFPKKKSTADVIPLPPPATPKVNAMDFTTPAGAITYLEGLHLLENVGCNACGRPVAANDPFYFADKETVYGTSCCGAAPLVRQYGYPWWENVEYKRLYGE